MCWEGFDAVPTHFLLEAVPKCITFVAILENNVLMKKIVLWVMGLCMSFSMFAQQPALVEGSEEPSLLEQIAGKPLKFSTKFNLQLATSGNAFLKDNDIEEVSFKLNRLRMEILGDYKGKLFYHFRQSFNSNAHYTQSLDGLSPQIEYAYLNYKVSERFTFTMGRQFLTFGGYEYYINPLRVREFSEFNKHIDCYLTGLTGVWDITPTQQLNFQLVDASNGGDSDRFVYGLPSHLKTTKIPLMGTVNWNGLFLDNQLQLRYAASAGQLAENRFNYFLTAGNSFENERIIAYLDVMYARQEIDAMGMISLLQPSSNQSPVTAEYTEYLSTIVNFDYRFSRLLNMYIKGSYERAGTYKKTDAFDKGLYRTTLGGQLCAEFYPLGNNDLQIYVHYLYKHHHLHEKALSIGAKNPDDQRISVGLVYAIPVF